MRVLPFSLLLLLLCAPVAAAQQLTGELVSAERGEPVAGAIVTLVDEHDRTLAGTLSDAQGRFRIAAPAAGRYRLKAERLGLQTAVSPPLALAAGQSLHQRLVLAEQPIALEGLTASATRRCRARPDAAGLDTHAIWEAARQALTAVALTENLQLVAFDTRTIVRDIHPRSGVVLSEKTTDSHALNAYPFRSRAAAELMEHGFMRKVGDAMVYDAPDAHVLLSDEFLDGYCFHVRRDAERDHLVGLGFEPIPERRRVPGVTGVLWLDRYTAELQELEFRYTRLPLLSDNPRLFRGRIEFERLDNGAWIVREWTIRAPRRMLDRENRRTTLSVSVHETAGQVLAITQRDQLRRLAAGVMLEGRLLDEDDRSPIAGAVVYLSGTQHHATTGVDGAFSLGPVREGVYLLAVFHRELDPDGSLLPAREVAVSDMAMAPFELLLPGLTTHLAGRCDGPAGGAATVAGVVRERTSGIVLPGARVELRMLPGGGEVRFAISDEAGRYMFCEVPAGREYELRAELAGLRSEVRAIAVAGASVRGDLVFDLAGPVRLVGRVIDDETGLPVASARVRVERLERTALTNAHGHFTIHDVPTGEQRVEVSHVGYGTHGEAVRIEPAHAVEMTIRLGVRAIALEGIVATVSARGPAGLEDFNRRMLESRARGGVLLDRAAIEQRSAIEVAHIVGDNGFVVAPEGLVNPRGTTGLGRPCGPTVYLDGARVTRGTPPTPAEAREALRMINPTLLDGIEIYRAAAQIPAELGGSAAGCGVVALWTRRGS